MNSLIISTIILLALLAATALASLYFQRREKFGFSRKSNVCAMKKTHRTQPEPKPKRKSAVGWMNTPARQQNWLP